jgi:hypothetical protein
MTRRRSLVRVEDVWNACRSSLADMFNFGQLTAVAGAFKLAGYEGGGSLLIGSLVMAP